MADSTEILFGMMGQVGLRNHGVTRWGTVPPPHHGKRPFWEEKLGNAYNV